MFPNAGQPGSGGMYPRGPMQRFGMPIPANTPPPQGNSQEGPKDSHRGERGHRGDRDRGGYGPQHSHHQQNKPSTHFSGPIIRQEDLKRMDEIGKQDRGWATEADDVDYNKKISFSDEEEDKSSSHRKKDMTEELYNDEERSDRRPVKILERKSDPNDRDHRDRDGPRNMPDMEDDRMRRKPHSGSYDYKEREVDRGRRPPEDDWRGLVVFYSSPITI